jgi:hypothetical protein
VRLTLAALGVAFLLASCAPRESGQPQPSTVTEGPGITFHYPESWEVSPEEAQAGAKFDVWFPTTSEANANTLTNSFMAPSGDKVIFRFPAEPSKVRQTHIEVFEAPWTDDESALSEWRGSPRSSPVTQK